MSNIVNPTKKTLSLPNKTIRRVKLNFNIDDKVKAELLSKLDNKIKEMTKK